MASHADRGAALVKTGTVGARPVAGHHVLRDNHPHSYRSGQKASADMCGQVLQKLSDHQQVLDGTGCCLKTLDPTYAEIPVFPWRRPPSLFSPMSFSRTCRMRITRFPGIRPKEWDTQRRAMN